MFVVLSSYRSKRVRRPRGSDPNDPCYTAKVVKHAPISRGHGRMGRARFSLNIQSLKTPETGIT
ncbi:hypothetical protein E2C01_028443 [Portunus trituberculatus]|uniref:Uncharacterized protein n=1 Tax=Portunus trituberculatus TaxID=210409 RepID=A0A5B7ERQ0_PORTR|nr:hypothetical protein [Portunus trituberculatus]